MDREKEIIPPWVHDEIARTEVLRGEARLEATWNLAERLKSAGETFAYFETMRSILDFSSKEARLDHKLRAFSEIRSIYHSEPRNQDYRFYVLWYFKWLVDALPESAEPSVETIERIFEDMTRLYDHENESPRPIYQLRCKAAMLMGDMPSAHGWYAKWQDAPPGGSDDCAACEADVKIRYLLECEKNEEALAAAEPIISGEVCCNDTPQTWTRLIGPALRLSDSKLSMVLAKISRQAVRSTPSMIAAAAAHAVYSVFLHDFTGARRMVIHSLRKVSDTQNDVNRFSVYRSCGMWAALTVLTTEYNKPLPARIAPGSPADAKGLIELPDLASRCLQHASEVASRLDARNGNRHYAEKLLSVEDAIRKMVGVLSQRRSGRA